MQTRTLSSEQDPAHSCTECISLTLTHAFLQLRSTLQSTSCKTVQICLDKELQSCPEDHLLEIKYGGSSKVSKTHIHLCDPCQRWCIDGDHQTRRNLLIVKSQMYQEAFHLAPYAVIVCELNPWSSFTNCCCFSRQWMCQQQRSGMLSTSRCSRRTQTRSSRPCCPHLKPSWRRQSRTSMVYSNKAPKNVSCHQYLDCFVQCFYHLLEFLHKVPTRPVALPWIGSEQLSFQKKKLCVRACTCAFVCKRVGDCESECV